MRTLMLIWACRDGWGWLRKKGVLGLVVLLAKWLMAFVVAALGAVPAAIGFAVGFIVMAFAFRLPRRMRGPLLAGRLAGPTAMSAGKVEPGVLVMPKATPNPAHNKYRGQIRTVHRRGTHAWLLEGIDFLEWSEPYLIVIGNPGPDEVDETLRETETT
jgi:hypothetical protein